MNSKFFCNSSIIEAVEVGTSLSISEYYTNLSFSYYKFSILLSLFLRISSNPVFSFLINSKLSSILEFNKLLSEDEEPGVVLAEFFVGVGF